jgi:hypothetical protein
MGRVLHVSWVCVVVRVVSTEPKYMTSWVRVLPWDTSRHPYVSYLWRVKVVT